MAGPYNYSGTGGMLSGGNTGFMPSLAGNAARAGTAVATGGTSEIIAQVLNLIPSIFQGIIGGSQLRKANLLEKQNVRPEAEIAPSVNKLVNYAYGRTMDSDIAGGTIARNEIKGATSAGIKAASELGSGSEAYGLMGELIGREQNQFADIAKSTAEQVKGAQGDYMNALGTKAGEENRVWDWNKADPYLQAARVAQQLRDSGMKNLFAGGSNIFGSAAEAVSPDFSSSLLGDESKNSKSGDISMDEVTKLLQSIFNK